MKFTADMYNIFRHFAYCQVSSDDWWRPLSL